MEVKAVAFAFLELGWEQAFPLAFLEQAFAFLEVGWTQASVELQASFLQ
jgi:hypothetical protein